jgi:excisionase family DNA binding protein
MPRVHEAIPRPIEEEDDVLDAKQAAVILKIHPVTVRLQAAAGQIPGRQIGNRWRFSRARIYEWLRAAA